MYYIREYNIKMAALLLYSCHQQQVIHLPPRWNWVGCYGNFSVFFNGSSLYIPMENVSLYIRRDIWLEQHNDFELLLLLPYITQRTVSSSPALSDTCPSLMHNVTIVTHTQHSSFFLPSPFFSNQKVMESVGNSVASSTFGEFLGKSPGRRRRRGGKRMSALNQSGGGVV